MDVVVVLALIALGALGVAVLPTKPTVTYIAGAVTAGACALAILLLFID